VLTCEVVEQAHRKKRIRRQQAHFNAGIHSILSWPMHGHVHNHTGF